MNFGFTNSYGSVGYTVYIEDFRACLVVLPSWLRLNADFVRVHVSLHLPDSCDTEKYYSRNFRLHHSSSGHFIRFRGVPVYFPTNL